MSEIEKTIYAALDDLARRRRIVTTAIRNICTCYTVDPLPWLDEETPAITETIPAAVETTKPKRKLKAPKREPKERKRATRPTKASEDDDRSVLAALKAHGPMAPGALAHTTGLSQYLLNRACYRLGMQVRDDRRVDREANRVGGVTSFKPWHRQPQPTTAKATGKLPWWATAPRDGMTKAAEEEQARMTASKEAKKVEGHINE